MNSLVTFLLGVFTGYNGHDQIKTVVNDIKKDDPVEDSASQPEV